MLDRIRNRFEWNEEEFRQFVAINLILALTVIVTLVEQESRSFSEWFSVFVLLTIFFFVITYCIISVQKIAGLALGYKIEYKPSVPLLGTGLLFAYLLSPLFALKALPWLFLGAFHAHLIPRLRLGAYTRGRSRIDLATIALGGVIVSMVFVAIFKGLFILTGVSLFQYMVVVSSWLGVCLLFPLPGSQGIDVFVASRLLWVFSIVVAFSYGLLSLVPGPATLFLSFLIAGLAVWAYKHFLEN